MFQFNPSTRVCTIFCKKCQTDIQFTVPENILEGKENFPIPYRYVHGSPPHSITIYLDKHLKIRGTEIGDTLGISLSALDSLADEIEKNSPEFKTQILQTWLRGFITISNTMSQDGKLILFHVGKLIGEATSLYYLQSSQIKDLLKELVEFWKLLEFGNITTSKENQNLILEIEHCFECSHIPKGTTNMCYATIGYIKGLFERKLKKKIKIQEQECIGNGAEHCRFIIPKFFE